MPLDTCRMFIAVAFSCGQLLAEQVDIFNPPGQALACHDNKLYFGNIQPAPMFGSIVNFQFLAILRASGAGNALYRDDCKKIQLFETICLDLSNWVLCKAISKKWRYFSYCYGLTKVK